MFEPKSIKDLVGNPTAHKKLEELMKDKTPALLVGPPGVGKTCGVHVIAKALGYDVLEINASDDRKAGSLEIPGRLRMVLYTSQMDSPFGDEFVIFLDEIDGMGSKQADGPSVWDIVKEILIKSKHPVVMACNDDYKIPESVKRMAIKVDFRQVDPRTVAKVVLKFAKEMNITPDMTKIGGDIRSGLTALYGGEGYTNTGDFVVAQRFFIEGGEFDDKKYPWIMDNIPEFYKGYDMYVAYKILSMAARINPEALNLLRKGKSGRVKYPTYWTVRKRVINEDGN